MEESQAQTHAAREIRGVLSAYFSRAKLWWAGSLIAQVLAILGGAATVLMSETSLGLALVLGAISSLASCGLWRGERFRDRAESLLRHTEFEDGFGWRLDPKLLSDALSEATSLERLAQRRIQEQRTFYASRRAPSPQRALDNLRESAWWSEHLSNFMGRVTAVGGGALLVVCLWSLLVAGISVGSMSPLALSNIVTAVVSLAFTGNTIRLPVDYFSFAAAARSFDRRASDLLRNPEPTERDALRLLHEYQFERARAPLIPTWAWRLRREALNAIWEGHRLSE
jgi:hypothetical protein